MMLSFSPALLRFLWPPLIPSGTVRTFACAAAALAALLVALVLVRLIWRIRWRAQTVTHYVHLRNRGNAPSVIDLGAVSPGRDLKFTYVLDGAVLPVRKSAAAPAAPMGSPASSASALEPPPPAAGQPASPQASAAPAAKNAVSSAGEAAAAAQKKAKQVSGIAALFIDILRTLGSLIPGSLGESLKQKATELQRQKAAVQARGQAPAREIKQAQHLKESVGDLKEELGPAKPGAAAPAASGPRPASAAPSPASAPAPGAAMPPEPARPAAALPCVEYVQLPALAPAASLRLALRATPANPYFKGESFYWVYTRAQGDPDRPPAEGPLPQKTVQPVSYAGIPLGFWLLSILLSAAAVLINGAWLYLFIRWSMLIFA
jgi:hypothetical protein